MNDLISRQAAIDVADAVWCVTGDKNVAKVWDQIKDLPSAQPKRGKWVDTKSDHYKCSCCGERAAFWYNEENSSGWEKDMSEWLSDFCPNCGADMRELTIPEEIINSVLGYDD